ncbi:MAG: hypothetical protein GF347_05290 [Candidatus Moranbacteria bacterium]|nr:hypothetical protein [Candidatus Moranbacteria bacterium]
MISKMLSKYCYIDEAFSFSLEKTITKLTILIPGGGCEYWKKTGGCSMCGFNNEVKKYNRGHKLPSLIYWVLFLLAIKKYSRIDKVSIYNGGSFINNREIPKNFRSNVYNYLSKEYNGIELLIESRCEYINDDFIKEIKKYQKKIKFTVAIGLESQDDYIRNKIIKKGLDKRVFEKKVNLLAKNNVKTYVYVLLKPPGISEKEAYNETIETIKYLINLNINEIELSCTFVQEGTFLADLYYNKEYKPPSLWTIYKILRKAKEKGWQLNLGKFTDTPPPISIPSSCPKCRLKLIKIFNVYRKKNILNKIDRCECIK